jgi:Nif-specific regulatory protein
MLFQDPIMDDASRIDEFERVSRESALYLRLLSLGTQTELEPLLQEALTLVVELTGAQQGYLELRDESDETGQSAWWLSHGFSDAEVADVRFMISRGIIAEAMATGETIVTQFAGLDERFRHRESVKLQRIEAVLCAPVAASATLGVVYLQGRRGPGPFSDQDRMNAEVFAQHLAPLADRLLVQRRIASAGDSTRELRECYQLEGIVGRSSILAAAIRQAMLAAPLDVNVLLTGESGTGKGQLARAIHANSPRSGGPFVEVNCAALPQNLFESELFGARSGSHSEAKWDRPGKVAAAEGGTLFLDEVAEIPLESQPKLLQLLQSRDYYPIGETKPVKAAVRIIAATNTDLEEAVREKRFREDLFFRLQVVPVRVPALRERMEDLRELAQSLCVDIQSRHGLVSLELSPGALRSIEAAEWRGNVRELEHAIEAAAIRAAGDGTGRIESRHVFPDPTGPAARPDQPLTFQESTRRFQRELIEQTLEETKWNVAEAARRLDLARSHVYNLIQTFGLSRK